MLSPSEIKMILGFLAECSLCLHGWKHHASNVLYQKTFPNTTQASRDPKAIASGFLFLFVSENAIWWSLLLVLRLLTHQHNDESKGLWFNKITGVQASIISSQCIYLIPRHSCTVESLRLAQNESFFNLLDRKIRDKN